MANFLIGTVISLGVSVIGSLLTPHKDEFRSVENGKETNFTRPKSSYGDPIPQIWGRGRVGAILAWATFPPTQVVDVKISKQKTGAKGGGATTTTEEKTYTYWGNCAFILSRKITQIEEIRLNSKLVWKDGSFSSLLEGKGCSIRIYNGTNDQGIDPLIQAHDPDNAIPYRNRAYVVFENLPLAEFGNAYPQCSAILKNGPYLDSPTLAEIISEICLESPYLTENDIDVTDVNDIKVTGFQDDKAMTPAEMLGILQKIYHFDVIDHGDKLKFQKQYRPSSVAYIPPDHLASYEDGQERPTRYKEIRTDPNDLPTQYEIKFLDRNNNLLAGLARSHQMPNAENKNILTIDYPGCLTEAEAKTIANRNLWLDWTRAFGQETSLPPRYCDLEPGDVIEVDINEITQKVQIKSLEIGANYQILAKTFNYNALIYGWNETADATYTTTATATQGNPINVGRAITGSIIVRSGGTTYSEGTDYTVDRANGTVTPIIGGSITNGTTPTITYESPQEPKTTQLPTVSPTTLRIKDIPLAYDSDTLGVYCFADGNANWRNAYLYISRDGGTTYDPENPILTRSIFGTCATTLANGTTTALDTSSTVEITVPSHAELSSISTELFNLGTNRALIGSEILDFQTATLLGTTSEGDRRYRLSNFKRGLRGTYASVSTHGSNEQFYLLSGYKLIATGRPDDIGKTLYFKAVSPGQTLADVSPVVLTIQGNALKATKTTITSFSPTQGAIGSSVVIRGSGFTNASAVTIGGTAVASFTVNSDSQITATIANGTTTGTIAITSPLGTATSEAQFAIVADPTVYASEEGTNLGATNRFNFVGGGVTATLATGTTTVTVPAWELTEEILLKIDFFNNWN